MSEGEKKKEPFDKVKVFGIAGTILFVVVWQAYIYPAYLKSRQEQWEAEHAEEIAAAKKEGEEKAKREAMKPGEKTGKTPAKTVEAPDKKTEQAGPEATPPKDVPAADAGALPPEAPAESPVTIETDRLGLVFDNRGGSLAKASLLDEKLRPGRDEPVGLLDEIQTGVRSMALVSMTIGEKKFEGLDKRRWKRTRLDPDYDADGVRMLEYETDLGIARVVKRFVLRREARHVELEVLVHNRSKEAIKFEYSLRGAAGILPDDPPDEEHRSFAPGIVATLAARREDGAAEYTDVEPAAANKPVLEGRRISLPRNLWIAAKDRFFAAVLIPYDATQAIEILAGPLTLEPAAHPNDLRFIMPNLTIDLTRRISPDLAAGQTSSADRYALYLGPAKDDLLAAYGEDVLGIPDLHLNRMITYFYHWDSINWISRKLLWLLNVLHGLIGSYGIAVVLVTIVVKLVLHPFQKKSVVSMHRMQKIQPLIAALQKRYENRKDPESQRKMQLEQLDLMKKHGANPAMGCLPILIQMPIFFALYGTFSRAFEMRQAPFLYIKDLSQPDLLSTLPFWPHELNLLPILYLGLMLYQTTQMPKPTDPNQELNYKMGKIMPVVFSFLFYMMPSGLVVYFVASSIVGLIENWYIRKRFCQDEPLSAGAGAGLGAASSTDASGVPGVLASAPQPAGDPGRAADRSGGKNRGPSKPRKG